MRAFWRRNISRRLPREEEALPRWPRPSVEPGSNIKSIPSINNYGFSQCFQLMSWVGLNRLIFCSIPLIYEQFFDGCFFFKHAPFNSLSFGLQATRRIFEFFKKLREFQVSTTINNVQAISVRFSIQQASSCANPNCDKQVEKLRANHQFVHGSIEAMTMSGTINQFREHLKVQKDMIEN